MQRLKLILILNIKIYFNQIIYLVYKMSENRENLTLLGDTAAADIYFYHQLICRLINRSISLVRK